MKQHRVVAFLGKSLTLTAFVVASAGALSPAWAQSASSRYDRGPLSARASQNVDDMREILRQGARRHIESSTRSATGGRSIVTSRDRAGSLASPAHQRGATDFVTRRDMWGQTGFNSDAARIARRAGAGHTAIVERVGPRYDTHTTYSMVPPLRQPRVRSYQVPHRATGDHIHVQPNYGIRARSYTPTWSSSGYSSGSGSRTAQ